MVAAFESFDLPQTQHAINLAYFIVGHVVNEIHNNNPTESDLASLAHLIAKSEEGWYPLDAGSLQKVLEAASKNELNITGVSAEEVMAMTVVAAAYTLAAYRNDGAGEEWFDYLDGVLEAYAAIPDGSATEPG
jgi:hypothetical protein